MKKSNISVSDIFVQKIVEKGQKVITKDEIMTLWQRSGGSKSRLSYAVSVLMGKGIYMRIARDLYIKHGVSVESMYWTIIKALIQIHSPSGGIIGGEKALEIHMMNYSIPDVLVIYTRSTSLRIRLVDGRSVHFRTLVSGVKTGTKNLYPIISRGSIRIDHIGGLSVPSREIALLEALSLREHDGGITESTVLRYISQYHTALDPQVFIDVVRYRYIRAINRLRQLSKTEGYEELYRASIQAIRREGGNCYISL